MSRALILAVFAAVVAVGVCVAIGVAEADTRWDFAAFAAVGFGWLAYDAARSLGRGLTATDDDAAAASTSGGKL